MKSAKETLVSFYRTPEQVVELLRILSSDLKIELQSVDSSLKAGNIEYAMTFIGQAREDIDMINRLLNRAKSEQIDIKKEIADETNKN